MPNFWVRRLLISNLYSVPSCDNRQLTSSNTLSPPPPPLPFREEDTREEGNLADVDSSSTSSLLTSTSYSGSELDRSLSNDNDASSVGQPVCNLPIAEVTRSDFYATKTDDEPVLKPSFLRNNRKGVPNDSGQCDKAN